MWCHEGLNIDLCLNNSNNVSNFRTRDQKKLGRRDPLLPSEIPLHRSHYENGICSIWYLLAELVIGLSVSSIFMPYIAPQ